MTIRPDDVIKKFTVEELCATAESYFKTIADPTPLMMKPFAFLHETPEMLQNMGLLLSGLRLGKTMTVLDFGAGTCWFSRFLTQLQCRAICCDASTTALEIGKKLYRDYPVIGGTIIEPAFLPFDGHRIDLADGAVDRIVCFDAFHHIPNPEEILGEFARVLKEGGIAGFSEPGPHHSRTPGAQYEMRNHRVLENDIDLDAIFSAAKKAGFTDIAIKLLADKDLSLDAYHALFDARPGDPLESAMTANIRNTMSGRTIFFLDKGEAVPDSRSHIGLAHSLEIVERDYTIRGGEKLRLDFLLTNVGSAAWLHENDQIFGIVRLASHLYDGRGNLISVDFSRHGLPARVRPGEMIPMTIDLELPGPGTYKLSFDLVSEGVTWFENVGSRPVDLTVRVL